MTKMWWNAKWLSRVVAAEHVLTSLRPEGEDDLVLEPGLVSLESPCGLNEAILERDAERDDSDEELTNQELDLDESEAEDGDE
jgi:hypothetical protein